MTYAWAFVLAIFSPVTVAATPGDPAKGGQIVSQVCAACHGGDGNSINPAYPSLAGQSAGYIATQLAYYKAGARKNPIMMGFAAPLSPEDMRNLGAYFEKQKPKPQAAKDKALAELGQKLYRAGNPSTGLPACAGCHGPNGAGIPVQFPRLAGQHADYTYTQLKAFNSGERGQGNAAIMSGVAAKLSEREMKALTQYTAGLR
ncbi:MAG: cytochrome c4 [Burkholderiales bacterium]|nr:cytochrome c4 [Burkholderiales bacterium]